MRTCLLWTLLVVVVAAPAFGGIVTAPNLGSAFSFAMLGSTLSDTGVSLIQGNVGATTGLTGFAGGPAIVNGTIYASGATAAAAYNDFVLAFNHAIDDTLTGTPVTQTASDLTTSQTFFGNNVYKFSSTDVSSTAGITLTFDGNSSDIFIIKTAQDLTINGPLTFNLIDGAQPSNIWWIVGRTASITAVTVPQTFEGSILAGTSFTLAANAGVGGSGVLGGTVDGCVFVETASTLGGQSDINGCLAAADTVPEPGSSGLVTLGCLLGALGLRKFRSVRQPR